MVQDISRKIKIALKNKDTENSAEHQIHQIQCITSMNGKTEYHGWTYAKNEVVLQSGFIRDAIIIQDSNNGITL